MERSILIISNRRSVQRSAVRALVSVGCEVQVCRFETDEIKKGLAGKDMFLVDTEIEPAILQETTAMICAADDSSVVLLVSNDLESEIVVEQILNGGLNNMIAKHGGVATNGLIDESELVTTCSKLLTGEIFGLEKYFPSSAVHKVYEFTLKHSKDRSPAIAEVEAFLEKIDCFQGIRTMIHDVVDELLMNAVFSAPLDGQGRRKYDALDRREAFELLPNENVQLRFGCDGKNVLVSVADNFGSLEREVIMKYLGKRFLGKKAAIECKAGGAGVGLFKIANSITQLVFNVHAGVRTEVIASFYIRSGVRAFKSSNQSFNLFLLREDS